VETRQRFHVTSSELLEGFRISDPLRELDRRDEPLKDLPRFINQLLTLMQSKNKEPGLILVEDRNAFQDVKLPLDVLTGIASDAMDSAGIVDESGLEPKTASFKMGLRRQERAFQELIVRLKDAILSFGSPLFKQGFEFWTGYVNSSYVDVALKIQPVHFT